MRTKSEHDENCDGEQVKPDYNLIKLKNFTKVDKGSKINFIVY